MMEAARKMLEVRNADGRLHTAREEHKSEERHPPIKPHDPFGPGVRLKRMWR